MANPLLLRAAPNVLARRKQVIESIDKLSSFERLMEIVEKDLGAHGEDSSLPDFRGSPIAVRLEFGWADAQERWPKVHGTAKARVPAVCQRCLEVCELELVADINLLLLASRDTRSADDALEIWELDHELLQPLDIVEEMLVMAMPLAPMHADLKDCSATVIPDGAAVTDTQDKIRPFANLKKQFKQSQ